MRNLEIRSIQTIILGALLLAALVGCGSSAAPTAAVTPDVPATVALVTEIPPTLATDAPATTNTDPMTAPAASGTPAANTNGASDTVTLVIVPASSQVRYRVREQLAGVSLPSDAIGSTNAITGQIVGKLDGTIVSAQSKFVVDVRTLQSDQGMRDNFIQGTPLQTSQYPTVTFVPTSAPGLPLTPSASGPTTFQLVGDLTIRDVTKPTTWQATCQLDSSQTQGKCSVTTTFTFKDFNLTQPRVGRVLSIEDKITLEADLVFERVTP